MASKFNPNSINPSGFTPEQLVACKDTFVASLKQRDLYSVNQLIQEFPVLATLPVPRDALPPAAQKALVGYDQPSVLACLVAMQQGSFACSILAKENPELLATLMHRDYTVGQPTPSNINNEGVSEEQPDLLHLAIAVQDINSISTLSQASSFSAFSDEGKPYGYLPHAIDKLCQSIKTLAANPAGYGNTPFGQIELALSGIYGLAFAGATFDSQVPAETKDAYEHPSAYDFLAETVEALASAVSNQTRFSRNNDGGSNLNGELATFLVKETADLTNFLMSSGQTLSKDRGDYLGWVTGSKAYLAYRGHPISGAASESANELLKLTSEYMVGTVATVAELSGSQMPRTISNLNNYAKTVFANDESKEMFNDVLRKMEYVVTNNKAKAVASTNIEAAQQQAKAAADEAGTEVSTASTRSSTRASTLRV